jgi:GMP synthase (glutamine-hydrolysing)
MIVAELLHRALGNRVWFIHMDTGFMRSRESERVSSFIEEKYGNLVYVDASREFVGSMRGLENAEEKRRMFSRTYFRILEDFASQIEAEYVSQGTIWPDIVESVKVFGRSVIKSQHNVSPPPGFRKMSSLKGVLEPLAGIFKHEERVVAWRLGLPASIVFRMPFPGPGLSVRNVGVITEDSLLLTEKVNSTVEECVKQWMLDTYGVPIVIEPPGLHRPWQALGFICRKGVVECKYEEEIRRIAEGNGVKARSVFLLQSRMTGVKGDSRTYERPLVIETSEGLLTYEAYERVFLGVTSIPRFRVSRVLFTVSSLRDSGKYVAGFRIVESMHAMTARNMRIPGTLIQEISERLQSLPEVGFVVYDVSNKPSATIEPE